MLVARKSLLLALWIHVLLIPTALPNLTQINPWLSACDLILAAPNARSDCPAAAPPPPFCIDHKPRIQHNSSSSNSNKTNGGVGDNTATCQCLYYFTRNDFAMACSAERKEWRATYLRAVRLPHCHEYRLYDALSAELLEQMAGDDKRCERILGELLDVDEAAAKISCDFEEVLRRYDCRQSYAVKYNCSHCKEAYRRWTCTALLPYFADSPSRLRIRPCRTLCQAVEQQCPYFLPADYAPGFPTQYAGEPTFLCRDSNIPETGEQQLKSLYPNENACCVSHCKDRPCDLCVRGDQCEALESYKAATTHSGTCTPVDYSAPARGGTAPSCSAPVLYTSPHHLPSAAVCAEPLLLILLACALLLSPLPHPVTLSCVLVPVHPVLAADLLVLFHLVPRLRRLLLRLVSTTVPIPKPSSLYFSNKKWQYYFILISVNLPHGVVQFLLSPSMTPCGHEQGSAGTRKARLKLINYLFSNLPISPIAQNRVVRGITLETTVEIGPCFESSCSNETRLIQVYHRVRNQLLMETTIQVINHSLRYKYVWYSMKTNINETYIKKYSKQRLIKLKKTNRCTVVETRHKTNLAYVGLCDLEREHYANSLCDR